MKIAILGGGITGLVAAYELLKKGHKVSIFEKEKQLGGLACGFKLSKNSWYLEKNIHHIFSNDKNILKFAKEIGFNKVFFKTTKTGNVYNSEYISRIIPLDSPQDLLTFPNLSFFDKIRTGLMLVFLKVTPFLTYFEEKTAKELIIRITGKRAWKTLWQELFRKKFGKYAGNILASFFWARIKKRTKKLGYFKGGFQELINFIENIIIKLGAKIYKGQEISNIKKVRHRFLITNKSFDCVISTLPTPALTKIGVNIFPKKYIERLKKIKHIHSVSVVLETKKPLIKDYYWLNILDRSNKIVCVATHTNLVDKKYYDNRHITFLFDYIDSDDIRHNKNSTEIFDFYIKNFIKINPNVKKQINNYYVFFSPFTQPIFDKTFIKNKPDFKTPVKNFYIANLDMTYPYDRGTNYAVKLGKQVAKLI